MIIKAGGHLIDHRSCIQRNCCGVSGLFPDPGPATQVFPHLRVHPWGFLKLCLSEKTHPLELHFEGTDLVVSEEVFHWGWPQPLSWENSDLSPPFPTPRSSGMNPVLIVSKNCPAIPDKNLCLFLLFKNHFQGPEQWAALYSSSVFLSPHFTLLTLLVPRGRCHTFAFEVFAVNARSQVLTI